MLPHVIAYDSLDLPVAFRKSECLLSSHLFAMPLIIRRVEETDMKDATEIYHAAYGTTSNIHRVIYPNGATEYAKAHMLKGCQTTFKNPNSTCYKIVDTEQNDRMVAWIDWETFKCDQPEHKWNQEAKPSTAEKHPDVDLNFRLIFTCGLGNLKRDYIEGKARVHIGRLTTHPEYHRRGAGKLLLDECIVHANRLQLDVFLEASPLAAPWYIREGFVPIDGAVSEIHMIPYGYEEIHKTVLMKRAVEPVKT